MPQETLAQTLRGKLGLTGLKIGCDRAECGACTVLIDDVPQYSCSILTHRVRGRKILTIEGLARPDGSLHPLQQGVLDEQGFQCGYCAPGFLMGRLALGAARHPARRLAAAVAFPGRRAGLRSGARPVGPPAPARSPGDGRFARGGGPGPGPHPAPYAFGPAFPLGDGRSHGAPGALALARE